MRLIRSTSPKAEAAIKKLLIAHPIATESNPNAVETVRCIRAHETRDCCRAELAPLLSGHPHVPKPSNPGSATQMPLLAQNGLSLLGAPGHAYARLYNAAYQETSLPIATGSLFGEPSNSIHGALSGFEMSLLTAAHEASHLKGNANNEAEANWYGIDAVLRYREDGGAKCAN